MKYLVRRGLILTIIVVWILVVLLIISAIYIESYPGKEIKFEYIDGERTFRELYIMNESYQVIESETELQKIWEEGYMYYPPSPPPNIDFNKSLVIAAFWGAQPNGGYSLEISKIAELDDKIVVYATHFYPDPYMLHTQAIVYPQAIVKIERTNKPIEFDIREKHTLIGLNIIYWPPIILSITNLILTWIYISKFSKRKAPHALNHKGDEPQTMQVGQEEKEGRIIRRQ